MWILILVFYAGTWAKGDSVSMVQVPGFKTEQNCMAEGNKAKKLETPYKSLNFVCLHVE